MSQELCKYCGHSKEEHGKGGHRCAGFSCLHGSSHNNCDYFNYRYDIDGKNKKLIEILELSKRIVTQLGLQDLEDMKKLYNRDEGFKKIVDRLMN